MNNLKYENIIIPIIFESEDVLVVNKPTGLVVNDSDTQKDKITLEHVLKNNYKIFSKKFNENDSLLSKEFLNRTGLVHRLDAATSGVLVIAKNAVTFEFLQKQFKDRTVKKTYEALVVGNLIEIAKSSLFTVNAAIARNPRNRQRFAIVKNGRNALTKFRVMKVLKFNNEYYSLLSCFPETGRTHQIRVHLKAMNTPIVGDTIYMSDKELERHSGVSRRMFLHARKLEIKLKENDEPSVFESELPDNLANQLKRLIEIC